MRCFRVSAVVTAIALVSLLGSAAAQFPTAAFAPAQGGPVVQGQTVAAYKAGRLLVQFRPAAARAIEFHQSEPGKSAGVVTLGLSGVDQIAAPHALRSVVRSMAGAVHKPLATQLGLDRWFRLEFAATTDMEALAAQFRTDPDVEAASPDYRAFSDAVPNDPLYSLQWGHDNTGQLQTYCWACGGHPAGGPVGTVGFDSDADLAWDESQAFGSSSIVIAIIDSGVDIDHPDLLAHLVPGWDYGEGDSNPDDDSGSPGHGTACAGVAAAVADNGLGGAGVAGGCSIMPLKVADALGDMYFSAIEDALIHAADNGVHVVSMSFSANLFPGDSPSTDAALQYAAANDVVLLGSTSNRNESFIRYPANHAEVIGVGAASPCGDRKRSSSNVADLNPGVVPDPNGYTCDGERWWGSNFGPAVRDAAGAVDVLAPTILPTTDIGGAGGYDPGDYNLWFNGTSAACPYAAGVCALIRSADPALSRTQVRELLTFTATDVVNVESVPGWDRYSGYGLVNAQGGVTASIAPPIISVAPASMSFTVLLSASDSAPLSISNLAVVPAYDVSWSITGCSWLSASPANGSTSAGVTDIVTVDVDALGLPPGSHNCSLTITSNDGANPVVTVPVTLNVIDQVDVFVSTAATRPVTVYSVPDGSGDPIAAAQNWDGVVGSTPTVMDATITVTLSRAGVPLPGHPADQIRLVSSAGGWEICAGQNQADGPTNAQGRTTFSGPLFAGGFSAPGERMLIQILGVNVGNVFYLSGGGGLDIRVNSPDINRDFVSNLSDVGTFAADLALYNYRSDFVWNGLQNLADVGVFASGLASSCPAAKRAPVAVADADGSIGLYFDRGGNDRAIALEPGRKTTAYLLLKGDAARSGITAWETEIRSSRNLEIHELVLPEGSIDFGMGEDLVVGTGGPVRALDGQALLLATLRVSVIDDAPASLSLYPSAVSSVGDGIGISTGETLLRLKPSSGATGQAAALINGQGGDDPASAQPEGLRLRNQPNPFNPATEIHFDLPHAGRAQVRIYDVSGRLVAELGGRGMAAGANRVRWNGTDRNGAAVVSGLYFYKLFLDGQGLGAPRKMSLVK